MTATSADEIFVGLISGTSMDGVDAAVVAFGDRSCDVIASDTYPYSDEMRQRLLTATRNPGSADLDAIGHLDTEIGHRFRDAALSVIAASGIEPARVTAIGSHGQTLRHQPLGNFPFSWQAGDASVIAAGTGITTVADFRRRDIALGGQGAPLAPAFHYWLWGNRPGCVVLNLGGIANLTLLNREADKVIGFDSGPANTLMDAWTARHLKGHFDADGKWARSGTVDEPLLEALYSDPYFALPPPKSTGFETFNLRWLEAQMDNRDLSPEDVQATLLALTVRSVADAVAAAPGDYDTVIACGGGVHNGALMQALDRALPQALVSSGALGVDPDCVEAATFAWLARQTLMSRAGNLPSVTGAGRPSVLGAIHPASGTIS